MKIMAVIPSLRHGGAERVLSLLSAEWAKVHSVTIVAFDASRPAYCYGGSIMNLRLSRPIGTMRKIWVACLSTVRLILVFLRYRPDKIVGFMEPANLPSTVAATAVWMRTRLIVSVHHNPHRLSKTRLLLMATLYRLPALVVAVSAGVAEAMTSLAIPPQRVMTIYNPALPNHAEGRPAPLPGTYILGVGRLHRDKGFDRLVRAFALLDCNEVQLVVVGAGEERESLFRLARELGISDRVVFPGAVMDVGEWYRHALCFVLTSRTEAFSMTLVEAMVHGCPVISFDCDFGPREIIDDLRNGILIEDGDIVGLAAALSCIVRDKEKRKSLASRGYERVTAYEVGSISARWISAMEAI